MKNIFLFLAPVILVVLIIIFAGVNVLYWDEWESADTFINFSEEGLSIDMLFAQHNEHRLFFPRILTLLTFSITNINVKVQMFQVALFMIINGLILFSKFGSKTKKWLILLLGFIIFTISQHQNFLWGFQVSFIMPSTFSLISLMLLTKEKTGLKELIGGILSAIVASFSSAHGLFIWPILLVYFILSKKKKETIIWLLFFIIVFIIYFINFKRNSSSPSLLLLIQNPIKPAAYSLAALGNIIRNPYLGGICGITFIMYIAYILYNVIKQKQFKNFIYTNRFWVVVLIFSFMFILAITAGRSGYSMTQGLASRYVTYTCMAWFCLITIFFENDFMDNLKVTKKEIAINKYIKKIALIQIICMLVIGSAFSMQEIIEQNKKRSAARELLLEGQNYNPDLYPTVNKSMEKSVIYLREHNLHIFKSN